MTFVHPLTDDEIEWYNRCSRTWMDPAFGMGSMKTPAFSNELKTRLTALAGICGVSVRFQCETDGQHYVWAVRSKDKKAP